jgi:hypothetical protein
MRLQITYEARGVSACVPLSYLTTWHDAPQVGVHLPRGGKWSVNAEQRALR